MERRVVTVVLLLLIFICAELAIATSAQASQINSNNCFTVDKNGGADYNSIQEAIDNAEDGFTIYVKSGTYSEIIEIKKQINLIGEDDTLINPISKKNKYAVRLGASGVMLRGFSITNGAPGLYASGIRVTASGTQILDCKIYDNPVGIAIWTSDNIIDNCIFWNCKDEGIALLGSSYSDCNNNLITNSVFYDNCDGIELQYSSGNTISNCEFYDNTHTGIDAIASSNNNNKISNCEIYNNEVHGIYFSSSSDNQIIDCYLSGNEDGDIVENKNSKNNQILTKNSEAFSSFKEKLSNREILNRFFEKLSDISNGRIRSIFASNNF